MLELSLTVEPDGVVDPELPDTPAAVLPAAVLPEAAVAVEAVDEAKVPVPMKNESVVMSVTPAISGSVVVEAVAAGVVVGVVTGAAVVDRLASSSTLRNLAMATSRFRMLLSRSRLRILRALHVDLIRVMKRSTLNSDVSLTRELYGELKLPRYR